MSLFITQCPNCRTSFKTNASQLRAADGYVRCGACLKIFSAQQHAVTLRDGNEPTPEQQKDDLAAAEIHFEGQVLPGTEMPVFAQDLPVSTYHFQDTEIASNPANDLGTEADSIRTGIEIDTVLTEPGFGAVADQEQLSPSDAGHNEGEGESEPLPDMFTVLEPDSLPESESGGYSRNEFRFHAEYRDDSSGWSRDMQSSSTVENERVHTLLDRLEDEDALGSVSPEELATIEKAPLELETAGKASRSQTALLTGCGILLLMLPLQYLVFNFHSLADDPRFRPLLTSVCAVAGCPLPEPFDISRIVTEELVVRSHPAQADALVIDFIFRNQAEFAQDFPLVELSFSTINGRLLANRRFTPLEYLPEELRRFGKMPPNTPVQISLEIVDPGPEAVNYVLAYRIP